MDSILGLRSMAMGAVLALVSATACAPSEPAAQEPSTVDAPAETGGGEQAEGPTYGPACGGIAGFSCPGAGICEDDPRDDCDPSSGGADCGGVCRCEPTALCAPGTVFDGSPDVCACVPAAERDDVCARVRCARGTRCVSEGGSARCEPTGD